MSEPLVTGPTTIAPVTASPATTGAISPVSTTPPEKTILSDAGQPDPATTSETSVLDDAKGDEKKEAKTDVPAAVVPEKYELKAPDGMTLDAADLEKFTPLAKELGLSNEQAQKLVDFESDRLKAMQANQKETQEASFKALQKEYKDETIKEYGPRLKEELVYVAKGRDSLADHEAVELLNATGLSNHKAIIRMFAKAGRFLSEDKRVEGPSSVGGQKSDGEVIFHSMAGQTQH